MNYNKQVSAIALLFIGNAFASQMPQIPTSALPIKSEVPEKPIARETQSTETALLFNAISKGDAHEVEKLLRTAKDAKALANAFDSKGWSALMRAVKNDNIVHILLSYGASANQTNSAGIPPLREALIAGNVASVKELLHANANVNQADNYGITPLMMAVSQGPADAVQFLILAGADVNAEDKGGQTVWNYSNFSSPRKVSPEQKAEIQKLLEEKKARKESIKKQAK